MTFSILFSAVVRVERKRSFRYGLILVVLILFCAGLGLVIWLSTRCWTHRCRIGLRVASHMNFAVDPCHDFYNFSCGGWVKRTELPTGEEVVSSRRLFFTCLLVVATIASSGFSF